MHLTRIFEANKHSKIHYIRHLNEVSPNIKRCTKYLLRISVMIIFTAMRGRGPGTPPEGRGRGPRPPSAAARGAAAGPPVARGLGAAHAGMIWNLKILVESKKNICIKYQKIF